MFRNENYFKTKPGWPLPVAADLQSDAIEHLDFKSATTEIRNT